VIKLLRPEKGSLVLGRQLGNVESGEENRVSGNGSRYRHNEASWRKLWEQAGEETGSKWLVEAQLGKIDLSALRPAAGFDKWTPPQTRILEFTVRRE
jgi:hypothetical protein